MKVEGGLARNVDFEVEYFLRFSRKTRIEENVDSGASRCLFWGRLRSLSRLQISPLVSYVVVSFCVVCVALRDMLTCVVNSCCACDRLNTVLQGF